MLSYFIRRLLVTFALLYVIATLAFLLLRLLPGDPVLFLLGDAAASTSQETVHALRRQLGLDQPLFKQYIYWLVNITRGNFGESLFGYGNINNLLLNRLPNSLELIIIALLLACLLGIFSGVLAAYYQQSIVDFITNIIATLGIAIPIYVLALIIVFLFAFRFKAFPACGYVSWRQDVLQHLRFLALPVLTLTLNQWALVFRMTRSAVVEVLQEGYVQTARAKGLKEMRVLLVHSLRNVLIPVITIVGLQFGRLLGATVLIEAVFNWPGISSLLLEGAIRRDYPLIQSIIVIVGVFVCITNLLVDLSYGILDPRVRHD